MATLKYKDPVTGLPVELPMIGSPDGGGGGVDGVVSAGAGLAGGGYVSTNPTLNVGQGSHIQVDADSVRLAPACVSITDWNAISSTGFYMGQNAANPPSTTRTGWWRGFAVAHNTLWVTVFAWPFNVDRIDHGAIMVRHKINGVWDTWYRLGNYAYSWDTADNFLAFKHGGTSTPAATPGVSRWAIGNKKGASTTAASTDDQFRIQRYDTAGNYAGNLMTGSTSGAVQFPGGHSLLREARESGEPVPADSVATVGVVVEMVVAALQRLGLLNGEVPDDLTGLLMGEASE